MDVPPSEAPRFSLGRSLLFSTVIVVTLLGAAEGLLRLVGVRPPVRPRLLLRAIDVDIDFPFMRADPELFWSPRPGFEGEFLGKPVRIDALGLRGDGVSLPKPPGRRRVVCFGDSITFGYGVGDQETYAFLLGRELAAQGVETVNAGVTGYTSHQVRKRLRALAPTLQADVATFCIGWNDGTRRVVDDREYDRRLHRVMAVEGLLDRVYIYRALKRLYLGALVAHPEGQPREAYRVSLPQYRENLEAIVALCRQHGIQPAFVSLPRRRQPGQAPVESPYPGALAAAARELGVPLLEAGPLGYDTAPEDNQRLFIDTLHFSPEGHAQLARLLAAQLVERGLVPAGPAPAP